MEATGELRASLLWFRALGLEGDLNLSKHLILAIFSLFIMGGPLTDLEATVGTY